MRNRIARACTVLAAGVAVSSVIGLSAATMASAATAQPGAKPAATPACGFLCFNLSSLTLGRNTIQNAYVPGNTGTGGKVGQKVNLHFASNTQVNADFTGAEIGTLGDFCPNQGLGGTGLCTGAQLPVVSGENVTLQNCGTSATTIWVGDIANTVIRNGRVYFPWVNAASTNFSHQLTLTVDPGTTKPINQLKLESLNKIHGAIPDTQQFTFSFGPVS
jgi:hypothetical protein